MTEREQDDRSDDSGDDSSQEQSGLIPDADAGGTDADSMSRDEGNAGHEEYKKP